MTDTGIGARLENGGVLSNRECQVLVMVADGYTNAEIAKELFLSVETIKHHVKHVLGKLGARSRAHAVLLAYREGIIG